MELICYRCERSDQRLGVWFSGYGGDGTVVQVMILGVFSNLYDSLKIIFVFPTWDESIFKLLKTYYVSLEGTELPTFLT